MLPGRLTVSEERLHIDLDTRLSVHPGLVLRIEDDDCALLFDPDNGRVQMLNRTAVDLWNLLDGKRSLRDVINCLSDIYDGVDDAAVKQILTAAETLSSLGAVGVWKVD
jgi:hypothetical protein